MNNFLDYIIKTFLNLIHVRFSVQMLSELEPDPNEPELWFRFGVWGSTLDQTQSPVWGLGKYSKNRTEPDFPITTSDQQIHEQIYVDRNLADGITME
jgi:hypothetical protein